mmetsp:Transcript_6315/g.17127  ORF Transcript_6315/g.17127 Transcript_6315/m.17127 type:complete len:379 (-) Transcript_6315:1219-2355(-)
MRGQPGLPALQLVPLDRLLRQRERPVRAGPGGLASADWWRQAVRRGAAGDQGLQPGRREERAVPPQRVGGVGRLQPVLRRGPPGADTEAAAPGLRQRHALRGPPHRGATLPAEGMRRCRGLQAERLAGVDAVRPGPDDPQPLRDHAARRRRQVLRGHAARDGDLRAEAGGLRGGRLDAVGALRPHLRRRADQPPTAGAAVPGEWREALPGRPGGGPGLQLGGVPAQELRGGRLGRVGHVLDQLWRRPADAQPRRPWAARQPGLRVRRHPGRDARLPGEPAVPAAGLRVGRVVRVGPVLRHLRRRTEVPQPLCREPTKRRRQHMHSQRQGGGGPLQHEGLHRRDQLHRRQVGRLGALGAVLRLLRRRTDVPKEENHVVC